MAIRPARRLWLRSIVLGLVPAVALVGCISAPQIPPRGALPDVAPPVFAPITEGVRIEGQPIQPMYRELLAIDLPTALRVAAAQDPDIELARNRVEELRGRYESSIGAIFPTIAPAALFERVDGTVRATEGNLVDADFSTFQPFALVQWIVNPGKVIYEMIAARKRLLESQYMERSVVQQSMRDTAVRYYELLLTRYGVGATQQALAEAQELLRITKSRVRAGTGLAADEMRARAEVASRQQDLLLALNSFYHASLELSVGLSHDPTVTLVPAENQLQPIPLVRSDLPIDDLLALAVEYRDDLQGVRTLIEAATADRGAVLWGGFGPQTQASYQAGVITGHAEDFGPSSEDETFGFHGQQRFVASASFRLGLSTLGDIRAAKAGEGQAYVEARRKFELVRAEVVSADQDSRSQDELTTRAREQVVSSEEALRLAHANHLAGTMTTLDILQAQSALAHARLRYASSVVRFNQAQVRLLGALGLYDGGLHAASEGTGESQDSGQEPGRS